MTKREVKESLISGRYTDKEAIIPDILILILEQLEEISSTLGKIE